MSIFNTSGPCNPNEHYTVMREALIAEGKEKVNRGKFFTIFAPGQSGKITYFQLLMQRLKERYTPIRITFEETSELIQQYVTETCQAFDEKVIKAIYENTKGQPGLVCGLSAHLVEKVVINRGEPIIINDFYKTLRYFLTAKFNKNIINIVNKAREKKEFMLKLLFEDKPLAFTVDEPDIAYLYANGVIDNIEALEGQTLVEVPSGRGRTDILILYGNEKVAG